MKAVPGSGSTRFRQYPVQAIIAILVLLWIGACGGEGAGEESLAEGQEAIVTSIVPTSRTCVAALVPGGCVNVPARNCDANDCSDDPGFYDQRDDPLAARILRPNELIDRLGPILQLPPITRLPPIFVPPIFPIDPIIPPYIDGKKAKGEYDGATVLPYTDVHLRASGGKLYLRANRHTASDTQYRGTLRVFLEDIPVSSGPDRLHDFVDRFVIFIDHDRFTGSSSSAGNEDRYYVFDFRNETKPTVYRGGPNGPGQSLGGFAFHLGKCAADPSTYRVMRCDAELEIPLPHNAFANLPTPHDDLQPGIGFSFYTAPTSDFDTPSGAIPEAWAMKALPQGNRLHAVSLLLGAPKGFPIRYMSWNIRSSSIGRLAGPFSATEDRDIGEYLADKADIIAIQEGWNVDKMEAILFAANEKRAALGLPPLNLYGPNDFASSLQAKVYRQAGERIGLGDEGTTSGLWIMSALPAAKTGFHAFNDVCKGEDCFKAKGVQHVRLRLNPPSPANHPDCGLTRLTGPAPEACGAPSSGDHYIDVFNVHTQADDTYFCSFEGSVVSTLAFFGGFLLNIEYAPIWPILHQMQESEFNCEVPDEIVRLAQLDEINRYIERVTSHSKDRPVVLMGDFNVDGKELGPQYQELISRLRIGPSNREEYPTSDIINPWRYDYEWDVDHGDLARELFDNWGESRCMGTYIGHDLGEHTPDCSHAENFDGNERFDYIFIRPPYAPDDPNYESAGWVAKKLDHWYSPYPGPANDYSGPPKRLSDHKPVMAAIEHAQIALPPPFHPNWKHKVEMRVVTADATGVSDCWGCGEVDPYTINYGHGFVAPGITDWRQWREHGSECPDQQHVSWPADQCMHDWKYNDKHDPGVELGTFYGGALFDADWSFMNSDDPIYTGDYGWPFMAILWDAKLVGLRGWEYQTLDVADIPIVDTAGVEMCTPGGLPQMCLSTKTEELPPGQQF